MKKRLIVLISIVILFITGSCAEHSGLVLVKGGAFKNIKSLYYDSDISLSEFYIGKYEITQKEWVAVMGYNPSEFKNDSLPVEMVSWYECIEYCNKRSEKEGLKLYYNIDKDKKDINNMSINDDLKWTVTINKGANGYRLPTEEEWEYAAGGGQESKSYTYSGNNTADDVAWYWRNAGNSYLLGDWNWPKIDNNNNSTKSIGSLVPNELGIYDMSGNVREWCWDWYTDLDDDSSTCRVWKGGGWLGDVSCCELSYRGKFEANSKGPDHGLRVCRNK
jgi:formylglycine-generating enzyme required for sulfatase activity